jgi:glutamyl-Q tRNA(Asp) synthetase
MTFKDKIQGLIVTHLSTEVGDLILRRRDKIFSYNLATACDDGADSITDVLRGADLLPLTNQQIFLMKLLKLEPPEYSHIPVVCYPDGTKLSKQSGATKLDNKFAVDNLLIAMKFLGLEPPKYLASVPNLLEWAIDHWSIENLPKNFQPYQ